MCIQKMKIGRNIQTVCGLKPNSWTYNSVEVSRHNLESSQTWGFCMDFWNQREGVCFPPFSFTDVQLKCRTVRGCVSLEKFKLLSGFRPWIRPLEPVVIKENWRGISNYGRWVAKLVASLLATAGLWVRNQISLKIAKWSNRVTNTL